MANIIEYPIVVSKLDPLIIRVNDLLLVVGSSSFSAKIKLGSQYTGFYVHVSGLGEPIAKVEVSIEGYNNTTLVGNTKHTMAYLHIQEAATKWMDDLQDSFTKASAQKNTVDMLKEFRAQLHFDMSGHIPTDPDVLAAIDTTNPTYFKTLSEDITNVKEQLEFLVSAMADLKDSISGDDSNSISTRLHNIETALGTESGSKFGDVIADSITNGLSTLTQQMTDMNNNITDVNNNVTSVGNQVSTVDTKVGTINTNVNTVKSDVSTVKSDVSTVKSDVGTVKTNVNTVSNNVNTVSNNVDNVKSTVNTIHSTDVPDIKSTVTGSSGGTDQAVSNLASTVNSMNGTVNNINGTVNGISGTVGTINTRTYNTWNKLDVLDTETLNDVLCSSDSVVIGDSTDGYFVRTELTKDDMITGPSGDKRVKADTD